VDFDAGERVTEVPITSGAAAPAIGVLDVTNDGRADLGVVGDFLYSEPQAIIGPTPFFLVVELA
jgi:hypothetical protein